MMAPMKLNDLALTGEFVLCIAPYVFSRRAHVAASVCRDESGGFEVNQWHQGLGDGRIDEMDMAGLVLGASPSLAWQRGDIIIVVNDGRSRCCGFWHAVGGRNGGCVNGWELHCEWVPNVNQFFVNDIQEKQARWLDWLSINGN